MAWARLALFSSLKLNQVGKNFAVADHQHGSSTIYEYMVLPQHTLYTKHPPAAESCRLQLDLVPMWQFCHHIDWRATPGASALKLVNMLAKGRVTMLRRGATSICNSDAAAPVAMGNSVCYMTAHMHHRLSSGNGTSDTVIAYQKF